MRKIFLFLSVAGLLFGCVKVGGTRQKISLFVGIDVSGSFYNSGHIEDAMDFLSYYLYGHLNQVGNLKGLKALFVGSIGGDTLDETKAFHPIQDFDGKSVDEIRENLKKWFVKSDRITDFNVFFKQVSAIALKRNLSLSPLAVVLVSDGIPDVPGNKEGTYESIDVEPLEYTSRNTSIRLLYASPVSSNKWETLVPRKRVRMWTADDQVMQGWKAQLKPGVRIEEQGKLWSWIEDNIDFRVQPIRFYKRTKGK